MISFRFFSKNGILPCAISTMRERSGWQQETGVPKSARQAEITVPRYPEPYTPICMVCLPSDGPKTRVGSGIQRNSQGARLLLIYKGGIGFSTHEREMYLGPCTRGEG